MKKVYQNVEFAANILIIIVAVLLISYGVQKYFFPAKSIAAQPKQLQPVIGSKIDAPNIIPSPQSKTLFLALQTTCHFCNESAPFYKRLIENIKDKNVKVVAVFPGSIEESAAHLKELGLSNIEVKQSSLNSLKVGGTPTLILTDENGEITNTWVGKLPPEKEAEVINKLNF